jgi:hypothetical protein
LPDTARARHFGKVHVDDYDIGFFVFEFFERNFWRVVDMSTAKITSVVAFDAVENHLKPFGIRGVIFDDRDGYGLVHVGKSGSREVEWRSGGVEEWRSGGVVGRKRPHPVAELDGKR